ncbi:MAG: hypothetical protein ACX930_03025 [Erythrobacter sp.]
MRKSTKSLAAVALCGATLSLAACGGHGPNTYLMAAEPIKAKLTGAEKTFTSVGNVPFDVRATSWQGDRLQVTIKGPSGESTRCEAVVEAIDEDWTRVSPDCAKAREHKTETELAEMHVDEFIIAVLYNKPMNDNMIAKRTSAIVIATMDDIQRRAANEIDEAAKTSEASYSSSDWGDSGGSDWGN